MDSEALCCRHRLQISDFVSSNFFKLQRNALVAVDDGGLGGGCRDRDICHSPQSLTPVNREISDCCTAKATFRLRTELQQFWLSLFVLLAQGKCKGS